jgi:hypothetical protein
VMSPITIVSPTFLLKTSIPSLLKLAIMTDVADRATHCKKQNSQNLEQVRIREHDLIVNCHSSVSTT